MDTILKYPRTAHLEGSRLQEGDEDGQQVPYAHIKGKYIVVEEKLDGANSGVRFSSDALLHLQSRGHYLTGGGREKHFNLLKAWATAHETRLLEALEDRYLMYGEWMHSKHTVFYDALPHYFLEFDLFDTHKGIFLSTQARQEILAGSPVVSVPVLYAGVAPRHLKDLLALIKPSLAKTQAWRQSLMQVALKQGLDPERILRETEASDLAEGLYIKIEQEGETVGRLKWVRADFLQTIQSNDSHWLSRPIVPNQLVLDADIFASTPRGWPTEELSGKSAGTADKTHAAGTVVTNTSVEVPS